MFHVNPLPNDIIKIKFILIVCKLVPYKFFSASYSCLENGLFYKMLFVMFLIVYVILVMKL